MIRLVAPRQPIRAAVRIEGSKSISNRLLILQQVLNQHFFLDNLSGSDDTLLLQRAITQLSASDGGTIDIGDAGSDMRFLTALLSVKKGNWHLTGSKRMQQRPIGELVDALRLLGADIRYAGRENYPPLKINGQQLAGSVIGIQAGVSSQFVTALLLIAPAFKNGLELQLIGDIVSRPYIDMTVELLRQCGLQVEDDGKSTLRVLPAPTHLQPPTAFQIESDWSSASYWYSICALAPGSEIQLSNYQAKSVQADAILPELYRAFGVETTFRDNTVVITSSAARVTEFVSDFSRCPDIAQTVAVTCCGLGIAARLTGLSTLRIKETDRISALRQELQKLGAEVESSDSVLAFSANRSFVDGMATAAAPVSVYGDHRMAMSFAPLSLRCPELMISDPEVVRKSYPAFWSDLKSAGFSVNLQP